MKVAVAGEIRTPEIGGPATYGRLIERVLLKRRLLCRTVAYGSLDHSPPGAVPRATVSLEASWTKRIQRYVQFLVSGPSPTVIFAQGVVAAGLPAAMAARQLRIPFVIRCAGDFAWEVSRRRLSTRPPFEHFDANEAPTTVRLLAQLQRTVVSQATSIIVPGPSLKRRVCEWGVDADRVIVIPNAPCIAKRRRPIAHGDPPTFLYVGRIVNWKGLEAIIQAFALASEKFGAIRLSIIGDGPDRSMVARAAALNPRIDVAHSKPHSEVLVSMANAFAVILNSEYECAPHVALEAQALGTPVLASDIPGHRDVITHRETGLLFSRDGVREIVDQMSELLSEPAVYERIAAAGMAVRAASTWRQMVEETILTLEKASDRRLFA